MPPPPNAPRTAHDERAWQAYGEALGLRLRAARETHGLSQRELADAAGVNSNTVKHIENGTSSTPGLPGSTTVRTLIRIAGALGVPPSLLLPVLDQVPAADPGARLDLAWHPDAVFNERLRDYALPATTEAARTKRRST